MSLPDGAHLALGELQAGPCLEMIDPPILPGGSGMRRISDIEVTDLPQPDSPTMASVSPSSTWNDTPSTARLIPSGVRK